MTTLAEPIVAHRMDYWTWVEHHAEEPDRTRLLGLRNHWRHVNETYFAGVMVEPYITLTEPSKPSVYGQCCPVSSWGSRLEIRIRPSLLSGTHPRVSGDLQGRWLFVLDVLMHEAVHQYHREVTGTTEPSYHGHGPMFAMVANRIGDALGLAPVVPRNRGGSNLPLAAQWPHCVTPLDYYRGAYRPRVPDTGDTSMVDCPHCSGTGRVPGGVA
ncbi:MAG TPA: hypothetical protein VFC00_06125 [Micromonosporaceae bacterium]|nr:hypothetical protein [Micromonosporaceae bacterium]